MIINTSAMKEGRINKGWTQQQLADVSGLSLRTIQRVESQGQGSMETCNALCAVLEMERRTLLEAQKVGEPYSRARFLAFMAGGALTGFLCGVSVMLLLR